MTWKQEACAFGGAVLIIGTIGAILTSASAKGTSFFANGLPVTVTQGPELLVTLLYAPPAWVTPALGVLALGTVVVAALGYRRHGLDDEVKHEMMRNGLIVICVGTCTALLVELGAFGYAIDVLGGALGGITVAYGLTAAVENARTVETDEVETT